MEFPFQPLDKAFLAGTQAPWASFAPVWRLELRGTVTEAQLVRALQFVLERYRWAAARVRAEHTWVLPDTFDARSQFAILDRPTPEQEAALADRFLALEKEAPLFLTWVRRSEREGALVFQQHHSLADGRAFFALITDFLRCVDAQTSPLPAGLVPRRAEAEAVDRSLGAFIRGALYTLKELFLGNVKPLTPLKSNEGTDYTGKNRTTHFVVPFARVEGWRAARAKLGLSTNDLLAGALCSALAKWSGSTGGVHNLLMMIDVRPRDGFESFANHLSTVQLRWKAGAPLELARALKAAASPVLAARLPWKRILFDGFLMLRTPMAVLRRALLVKRQLLTNHSFSNLIALGPAEPWRTKDLVVEGLRITTPCTPPQAVNTTVVRYGESLCFNFNFKDSAISPAQVDALIAEFARALDAVEASLAQSS